MQIRGLTSQWGNQLFDEFLFSLRTAMSAAFYRTGGTRFSLIF